jgi:hypothetical protein
MPDNHMNLGQRAAAAELRLEEIAIVLPASHSELASVDRRSENVVVLPIVVPESEFGNIEREVLNRYLVERAHDPALQDRPESLDGVGMGRLPWGR